MDLRCESKKLAELDGGVIEFKCDSRFCGAAPDVVVLHRFDAHTGDLVETLKFKNPNTNRKDRGDASFHHPAAVRSA